MQLTLENHLQINKLHLCKQYFQDNLSFHVQVSVVYGGQTLARFITYIILAHSPSQKIPPNHWIDFTNKGPRQVASCDNEIEYLPNPTSSNTFKSACPLYQVIFLWQEKVN